MSLLDVQFVKKKYGEREVVRGVNLTVNRG